MTSTAQAAPHDGVFCRIAHGELPCHAVYQSASVLAFLDLHPVRPGHVPIIPRDHHAYFNDLPADPTTEIMLPRMPDTELAGIAATIAGALRAGA